MVSENCYRDKLYELVRGELDFHDKESQYASHNFHSFPAKFPPQLPRKFILGLTREGDLVLDPMNGSGTTTLEAFLTGRSGLGFDIDPLALKISRVKVTPISHQFVKLIEQTVVDNAILNLNFNRPFLEEQLRSRWDEKTKEFIDYWFLYDTQLELIALIDQIEKISNAEIRNFMELVFSAIVITKSGGVSLALDLAHTRPHKAKVVYDIKGKKIIGEDGVTELSSRSQFTTKKLRSAIEEFRKRFKINLVGLIDDNPSESSINIMSGNAQDLPICDNFVDLIVTSPPYASNAIDYMRAHKFSLVWLGYSIEQLGGLRGEYIGGDSLSNIKFEEMPTYTNSIINGIGLNDGKKANVLRRYFSEMHRAIKEMYRVLKHNRGAVIVVGTSIMRGQDSETHYCLADIAKSIGFEVPGIGTRNIDRNRRMMPAGLEVDETSQIQQRMHKEYVLGLYKP
jgi:DNA modification methylase